MTIRLNLSRLDDSGFVLLEGTAYDEQAQRTIAAQIARVEDARRQLASETACLQHLMAQLRRDGDSPGAT